MNDRKMNLTPGPRRLRIFALKRSFHYIMCICNSFPGFEGAGNCYFWGKKFINVNKKGKAEESKFDKRIRPSGR
jgi:hypothetical protein